MKLEIDFNTLKVDDDELAGTIEYVASLVRDGYTRGFESDFNWFINKDSE
jgi:hypothetical protein